MITDSSRVRDATALIEGALFGDEPRRGIWTDRDYLIHALAILTDSGRAQTAAVAKPKALLDSNKPLKHKDEPWWWQYEDAIQHLNEIYEKLTTLVNVQVQTEWIGLAADDIRTLVDGLRDLERKLGETHGPDPAQV